MIRKPTIIVTSLGRTGTKFFQALFADTMPDADSLHEPDYLNFGQYEGMRERIRQVIRQLQESGLANLIIRKLAGNWNLVALSDARMLGILSYDEATQKVLAQRKDFILTQNRSVYIESSSAYWGLIDVLPSVFQQHRLAYIVRDGRDWVRSKMNFGRMYKKGKIRSLVSHTWPTARQIENDLYQSRWTRMSRFEKICWAWARFNRYALDTVEENPYAKVFRFEDIFKSEHRYQHLSELVNFVTNIPDVNPVPASALEGWLDRRIHRSSRDFPAWSEWSVHHKRQFAEICGPFMEELSYEL